MEQQEIFWIKHHSKIPAHNLKMKTKSSENLPMVPAIIFLSGLALVTAGSFACHNMKGITSYLDNRLVVLTVLTLVIGVLSLFFSYFGYLAAIKHDVTMLKVFNVFIIVIFLFDFSLALFTIVTKDSIEQYNTDSIEKAVRTFDTFERSGKFLALVQPRFQCCGIHGSSDYDHRLDGIPSSCCKDEQMKEQFQTNNSSRLSTIYIRGCSPVEAYPEGCSKKVNSVTDTIVIGIFCLLFIFSFFDVLAILCVFYVIHHLEENGDRSPLTLAHLKAKEW